MKKYLLPILVIIAILTHWQWFFNFSILSHGDWGFFFQETQKQFLGLPFGWLGEKLGNTSIASLSMYPINVLWGFLGEFSDFSLGERIIYLFPSVLFAVFGGYLLALKILGSRVGAFISSIVFTFNTYFILGSTGHLTLMVAFSMAPFVILLFMNALEKKEIYFAVWAGLVGFVVASYEFRSFYIVTWILLAYFLYYIFVIEEHLSFRIFFRVSIIAVCPIIIVGFLSLYWIAGFSQIGVITNNEIFSRGLFGNNFMSLIRSIDLFHPFWTGGEIIPFEVQSISWQFFIIPIVAFLGLWLNRKNKNVVFFGFIALLGILLSKQVDYPLADLYKWLYENLPGFNAFREASKFYFLIALGYSVLIGAFASWLWENWKDGRQRVYRNIVILSVTLLFLWNTKPLITGEIGTLFVSRHIPKDYLDVRDFLLNQDSYFRTLWVPEQSRWSFYVNKHPKIGMIEEIQSDWDSFSEQGRWKQSLPTEERITMPFSLSFWDQLLDISSVKYVFVPLQDIENDDDFFRYYGSRQFFVDTLDNISYLRRIDIGAEEIVVYENENYRPHIYETDKEETIYKGVPFKVVDFTFQNSTEYYVALKNINKPEWVNFSEKYHPEWKVRVGDFNWFDVLRDKNYFLPDSYHAENDAKLNSFLIDPKYIKQNFPKDTYRENPDGSIDVDLTLYFKPQSYFYLGLIVSGVTLAGCLGCLSYVGIMKIRNKKFEKVKDK